MEKVKLKEILEVRRGTSLSGKYYSKDGELIRLTLGNFNYPGYGFKENTSKEDTYFNGEVKQQYILKKGDIITPLTEQVSGLLGETATIPENNKYIQSGDIGLVIPKEEKLDKRFAYYLISSSMIKKQLDVSSQQTKIRHTSPDKIKDCIAWIPEKSRQVKIAKILDEINDAIDKNSQINNNLEELMQTLYQRWFIEFNFPNKDGKPYKSSGGKMVWNEELKQEIPEEWKVENLYKNTLSSVIKNGIEKFDKKIYLETADINNDCISNGNEISFNDRPSRANMQPRLNSVWFAKMKNSVKHLSLSESSNTFVNKYILSTGMYGLQCDRKTFPYIHSFINSIYFEPTKDKLAHGATQQAVNDNDIKNIKIICPSNYIIEEYSNRTYSILEEKNLIQEENRHLTELRDFLLPMLMNGQINVDDVEI